MGKKLKKKKFVSTPKNADSALIYSHSFVGSFLFLGNSEIDYYHLPESDKSNELIEWLDYVSSFLYLVIFLFAIVCYFRIHQTKKVGEQPKKFEQRERAFIIPGGNPDTTRFNGFCSKIVSGEKCFYSSFLFNDKLKIEKLQLTLLYF